MKRMRWSVVRTLLASVLFGSIAAIVVAAVLLSSNIKSKEQVYSVKVGMTQADVLKELGNLDLDQVGTFGTTKYGVQAICTAFALTKVTKFAL